MRIGRRALLKAGAAGIAASASAPVVSRQYSLIVFDSRLPPSRAFARNAPASIDIAREDANFWRSLRDARTRPVSGLTGWSDFVTARGFLEERGLRVKAQSPLPGEPHLFRWEMA